MPKISSFSSFFVLLPHLHADTSICPCRSWWKGGDDIVGRRLLGALVLTFRNFATSKVNQKQSSGRCHGICLLYPIAMLLLHGVGLYVYISAWGLRCSFRLTGQCEGLEMWDE